MINGKIRLHVLMVGIGLQQFVPDSKWGFRYYDLALGGCWCSNRVQGPYGVGMWKNIRKEWDTFHCFVNSKVGGMALLLSFGMILGVRDFL